MKKYLYNILLVAFVFISIDVFAQNSTSQDTGKNVVYVNASTLFVYSSFTVNYDRRIKTSDKGFFKHYYLNAEAGFYNLNSGFVPGTNTNGVLTGIGIVGLTGKNKSHFEVGLSVDLNIETTINNEEPDDNTELESVFFPDVTFGYRYQIKEDILFRVGLGFPKGIYIGLGYSF